MNYKQQHIAYNLVDALKSAGFVNPAYASDANGEPCVVFDGGFGLPVATAGSGGGSVRILDQRGNADAGWDNIVGVWQTVFTTGVAQLLVEGSSGAPSSPLQARSFTSGVSTGVGTANLTVTGGNFTNSDVGRIVVISNATADNGTYRISSVTSGTVVVVQTTSGGAVSFAGGTGGAAVVRTEYGFTTASGTITCASVVATNTIAFSVAAGGALVTLTASATPVGENQFLVNTGDNTAQAAIIAAAINAHSLLSRLVYATSAAAVVTVRSLVGGYIGNGFTITGTTTTLTPAAATAMTGGSGGIPSTGIVNDDKYNRLVAAMARAGLKVEVWVVPAGTAPLFTNFSQALLSDEVWPNDTWKLSSLV